MTRRIHAILAAGAALALAATLTSCGGDEGPGAVEKDLAERCGGRISAGSLDLRFEEGTEAEAQGAWHKDGRGQCRVSANDERDWWTPFSMEVTVGDSAEAVEALRRRSCATTRDDPGLYLGYADGEGFCSAYLSRGESAGYQARGSVGRYFVDIRLPGRRPGLPGDPEKKARETFSRVMDDLRDYYKV
ncbi:hypothetical protein [Streptomyces sp. NPDC018947]|uniref:hypothetical protein n=1 Tax=Streptomyces sp. NPDC018947 TaxID=3365054 RepID=UPI00379B04D5